MKSFKISPLHWPALLLLAILAASPAAGETAPATPRFELEPCRLPGLDEEVRCGTYEVFEDRAAGSGRKIPLRVVVLPATGPDPAPDPMLAFAGGPGGSVIENAAGFSFAYADMRRRRDMVLIDVRGTGDSNPLFCPYQSEEKNRGVEEVLETFLPVDELPECLELLRKETDPKLYTTAIVVDDVEEIRAALGYPKINLMGGSYGTRPVQVYMRRYPEVVRSAVIEGVVPMDARSPLTFARDAQTALDGVLAECAADDDCHRAFPDPRADLEKILARLDREPVLVAVTDPKSGEERELRFSRNVMIQTLRYMLYNALRALQVPAYLHTAAAGDYGPIGQVAYTVAGGLMSSVPDGFYLSVTCSEDVAFIEPAEAERATAGTFLGDFRLRQQLAACERWVRGELPEGFIEPVESETPVLLISGERDPVTPARWGEAVARHLPRSRHLVIPDGAHGSFGLKDAECVERLTSEFVERGAAEELEIEACVAGIGRPPFLLEIAADEPIELSEAELGRFAGSYAAEGGLQVVVELVEGALQSSFGDETDKLFPVAPTRFAIVGSPPGVYWDFELEDGEVVAVSFLRTGTALARLERRR